jgi:hypothetical protein
VGMYLQNFIKRKEIRLTHLARRLSNS